MMNRNSIGTIRLGEDSVKEERKAWRRFSGSLLTVDEVSVTARHRTLRIVGLVLALLFGLQIGVSHQALAQDIDIPEYDVDVVSLKSKSGSDRTQVDLYTRIPFSKLRFLASPDGFTARYEVSVEIVEIDSDGRRENIVQSPIWERSVRVPNYADTQVADHFDFSTHTLDLAPGRYSFEFQVEDKSSSEAFLSQRTVVVKDYSEGAMLSDLLLLDSFEKESNTISPRVAKRVASTESEMILFYELYLASAAEITVRREVVRLGSTVAAKTGAVEGAEIISTNDEKVKVESARSQHISKIKVDELTVGSYEVLISALDNNGVTLASTQMSFEVDWSGLEEHLANLDDAIAQLQYIAKNRDIRYIREGAAESDKWKRFEEFWRRRDPTPGTARNEKMEEYYYRVSFANRRYSSVTEGWRTDRGQVMVLYGQPDIVEYHPFNFSVKPYEVWYYYQMGRRFIFVDETGLGDYELLVPIWDETTRIR